ncbi:MAG: DUF4405 domain-containing protein [Pseudomonadota bacterium]
MIKNKQSTRSLVAFLVTWSFLILTVSGIVLYIVPQGRIAYWIHWSLSGLDKEQWSGVHMMFGGLFIVTGILHLYYNWKPFKRYLVERARGQLQVKQELVASLVFSLAILLMSVYSIPPVSWVFDLNAAVKDAWVSSPELEPPFGHAEEISFKAIVRRMGLDQDKAVESLEQAGIRFAEDESLATIANANGMNPMEVYGIFSRYKIERDPVPLASLSPEEIEARLAGTGVGRRTLAQVNDQLGLDAVESLRRLAERGIDSDGSETLRTLADSRGISPIDILKLMIPEAQTIKAPAPKNDAPIAEE